MLAAVLFGTDESALFMLGHELKETGLIQVWGLHQAGLDLLKAVSVQKPDVVFVEIDSLGQKGLSDISALRTQCPAADVVFVSSNQDWAMQAFDLDAVDYLLKPVQKERLLHTLEKLQEKHSPKADRHTAGAVHYKLQCLGEFVISNEDGDILHWPTKKSQELVAFLWYHRKSTISTSALVETLWPHLDGVRARNNLYTTIYSVKKVLNSFLGKAIRITKSNGGYQLFTAITSDYEQLEALLDRCGKEHFEENLHIYKQALLLYVGHLFESEGFSWAENAQAYLLELIQKHGLRISNRLLEMDRWREAQEILQYLLLRDPFCEGAHVLLIRMHARAEDIIGVKQSYAQYSKIVRQEFGIEPRNLEEILSEKNPSQAPRMPSV